MPSDRIEPPSISEPIDPLHRECIEAREAIRMHVKVLQDHAAAWQPRPCPARLAPPREELDRS